MTWILNCILRRLRSSWVKLGQINDSFMIYTNRQLASTLLLLLYGAFETLCSDFNSLLCQNHIRQANLLVSVYQWARCEGKQNKKQKLYADDSGSRVDLNLGIYEILYWIKGHVADSHQPPPIFPASSTTRFESFDEF